MFFHETLLRLRKERGLKQTEVVEGTGISLRTYQHYEHGEQDPPRTKLIRLADFYDISLDELVGRDWPRSDRGR